MAPTESPDSHLGLVSIFESNDAIAIGLAQGLLEDSGIPFCIQSDESGVLRGLGPILLPSCRFMVPKDREEEARELLQILESPQEEEGSS